MIIDIKMLEVQRVNKKFRKLKDLELKKQSEIAALEKKLSDENLALVNLRIEIRELENLVVKELKRES